MASAVVLGLSLRPGPPRCLQPTTPVGRCLRRGFESRRKVWVAIGPPGTADRRFSTLTFVSARERPQRVMRAVASPLSTNPIELRIGALSPVNAVVPALAVANAFGAG